MAMYQDIDVPSFVDIKKSKIRVIYNNAWNDDPTACSTNIVDGMAYDLNLKIKDQTVDLLRLTSDNQWEIKVLNQFKYQIIGKRSGIYHFQLFDTSGLMISSELIQISENTPIERDITFNKGCYIMNIKQDDKLISTLKFIV